MLTGSARKRQERGRSFTFGRTSYKACCHAFCGTKLDFRGILVTGRDRPSRRRGLRNTDPRGVCRRKALPAMCRGKETLIFSYQAIDKRGGDSSSARKYPLIDHGAIAAVQWPSSPFMFVLTRKLVVVPAIAEVQSSDSGVLHLHAPPGR